MVKGELSKKLWTIAGIIAVTLFVIGLVCFALSLLLGADLVRIADVVFGKYDLAQTYLNFREFFGNFWIFS